MRLLDFHQLTKYTLKLLIAGCCSHDEKETVILTILAAVAFPTLRLLAVAVCSFDSCFLQKGPLMQGCAPI